MVIFFLTPIGNSWFLINYIDDNFYDISFERNKVNKTDVKLRVFAEYELKFLGKK
jgi:hypothetical protein